MNAIVKHIIEIAGGLVVGGLLSDAANGVVKVAKDQVVKIKKKG